MGTSEKTRGDSLPAASRRSPHAAVTGASADRVFHLARREHRHLLRPVGVSASARRLSGGSCDQVERVVIAGAHELHHRDEPEAHQGHRARTGVTALVWRCTHQPKGVVVLRTPDHCGWVCCIARR